MSADPAELFVVIDEIPDTLGPPEQRPRGAWLTEGFARAHLREGSHVTPYVPKADLDAAREELELAFERGRDAGREATSELIQRTQVKPLYDELQLARAVCEAADVAARKPSAITLGTLDIELSRWKESRSRG